MNDRCTVCGHVQHRARPCGREKCMCGVYDRFPKFRPRNDVPQPAQNLADAPRVLPRTPTTRDIARAWLRRLTA